MLSKKKYAIYGGTFDPVHMAHIILADIAVKEIGLDELIFMPAYISPFKQDTPTSSGENRYNMITKILNFNPAFRVSDYEFTLKSPSYTINTLEYFDDLDYNKLYFLLGFDSLMEIESWHRGTDILIKFPLLTGYRPGTVKNDVISKIEYFREKYNAEINVLDMPPLDISATDIRRRILNGYSIKGLVHPKVEEYIFDNKLYQ
ncbi:MAG TPA: nicotinate (nicotinamide) nucleotide adenylyltransferase [Mogibacterium sp.]|nr:nicotinate (nicotinamide) nucleotide adenylyltransferase [Mogibacterium sp.]